MSTTLAQLQSDVLTIVKRPDMLDAIALHTRNAILKVHTFQGNFFTRDLYENAFQFASPAVEYSLDFKSLVSRWRKTKYLTILDPNTLQVTKKLTALSTPDNLADIYGYLRDYCWYEAGSYLQIRVSGSDQLFGFGCYLFPDTTLQNPSWIADEFPSAIHYEAARTFFKATGYDEQSASMDQLFMEAMQPVIGAGIATVGE